MLCPSDTPEGEVSVMITEVIGMVTVKMMTVTMCAYVCVSLRVMRVRVCVCCQESIAVLVVR